MTEFKQLLEKIVAREELETEWLDMLAQLEYAGCRKIMKAVPFKDVNFEVVQHVSEEASHAFLLKALVDKARKERPWVEAPLTQIGWKYFQTLDHGISRLQGEAFHYPAVSWVVEQRVLEVYPAYLEATQNPSVKRAVSRILAQEKRHSAQFDGDFPESFKKAALALEAQLWSELVESLDAWANGAMIERKASVPMTASVYI